jgi:hypothetical protein
MRCDDLAGTWAALLSWFDAHGVLVLPQLAGDLPVVQLDSDLAPLFAADPAEALALAVDRVRAVVDRFDARAVYVHRVGEGTATRNGGRDMSILTVRVVGGGVVHELTLVAAWYANLLNRTVGMEFAHRA